MITSPAQARLILVETVANILFDLAIEDNPELLNEEMLDSMRQVSELIWDTLDCNVVSYSEDEVTLTVSQNNLVF